MDRTGNFRRRAWRLFALATLVVVGLGGCASYGYGDGGYYSSRPSVGYYGSYGNYGYSGYGYGGYGYGYGNSGSYPYGYSGYGVPYGSYSGYYGYPYRNYHRPRVVRPRPPVTPPPGGYEGRNDQPAWRDRDGRYVRQGSHPLRPPHNDASRPAVPSRPLPVGGVEGPPRERPSAPPRMERPDRVDRGPRPERSERPARSGGAERPAMRERDSRERDARPELTP